MGSIPIGSMPPRESREVVSVRVATLDHLVLTVASIDASITFYEHLGMRSETFGDGRRALRFGRQRLHLHEAGAEIEPYALRPVPGSADLCFLVEDSLDDVVRELAEAGIAIELGPVERLGAVGAMESLYLRDPDGNLVELARAL
jgi:catechol 2,3-dioxygenase-like lactoylglutathione lyase family enzyme